jgi:hypothetical protein
MYTVMVVAVCLAAAAGAYGLFQDAVARTES